MAKKIYETKEWKGIGKQNYFHNEYRQDGDTIEKIKCHDFKSFDGHENEWVHEERVIDSWTKGDSDMPDWLNDYTD